MYTVLLCRCSVLQHNYVILLLSYIFNQQAVFYYYKLQLLALKALPESLILQILAIKFL